MAILPNNPKELDFMDEIERRVFDCEVCSRA